MMMQEYRSLGRIDKAEGIQAIRKGGASPEPFTQHEGEPCITNLLLLPSSKDIKKSKVLTFYICRDFLEL